MRILILDDMQIRHDTFKRIYQDHEVVCVFRFREFLSKLDTKFDLIHLDHDLGDEIADADTFVDGWGKTRWFDGQNAAQVLCELSDKLKPTKVIVHSVNSVGAKAMVSMLARADIPVVWEPFGEIAEE